MDLWQHYSVLSGQRAMVEVKMKEFEALRLIGKAVEAEKCREDAHALLDAWFDGQGDMAETMRRGGFSPGP